MPDEPTYEKINVISFHEMNRRNYDVDDLVRQANGMPTEAEMNGQAPMPTDEELAARAAEANKQIEELQAEQQAVADEITADPLKLHYTLTREAMTIKHVPGFHSSISPSLNYSVNDGSKPFWWPGHDYIQPDQGTIGGPVSVKVVAEFLFDLSNTSNAKWSSQTIEFADGETEASFTVDRIDPDRYVTLGVYLDDGKWLDGSGGQTLKLGIHGATQGGDYTEGYVSRTSKITMSLREVGAKEE